MWFLWPAKCIDNIFLWMFILLSRSVLINDKSISFEMESVCLHLLVSNIWIKFRKIYHIFYIKSYITYICVNLNSTKTTVTLTVLKKKMECFFRKVHFLLLKQLLSQCDYVVFFFLLSQTIIIVQSTLDFWRKKLWTMKFF